MTVKVKICGLRSRADAAAAVTHGTAYVGLVFFPPSPRHMTIADARWVLETVPEGVRRVALTVDADDATLEALVAALPLDMLQLHGHETPERVVAVRERFGLPVMKAVGLAGEADWPSWTSRCGSPTRSSSMRGRRRMRIGRAATALPSTGG